METLAVWSKEISATAHQPPATAAGKFEAGCYSEVPVSTPSLPLQCGFRFQILLEYQCSPNCDFVVWDVPNCICLVCLMRKLLADWVFLPKLISHVEAEITHQVTIWLRVPLSLSALEPGCWDWSLGNP